MSIERLIYLPLGGAGEIGMNCYVYGFGRPEAERLIVVDLGVTFPDMDGSPGVDLILPDVTWLVERKDRIDGIFITHAHEDHLGAVAHLYDQKNELFMKLSPLKTIGVYVNSRGSLTVLYICVWH